MTWTVEQTLDMASLDSTPTSGMGRIPPGLTEIVRKLSVSIALSSFSVRPLMRENNARPFSL
jgi:hypothetical protein